MRASADVLVILAVSAVAACRGKTEAPPPAPASPAAAAAPAVTRAEAPAGASASTSNFVGLVRKLDPSVVAIRTTELVAASPFDDVPEEVQGSLGSGVIVDASGLIVTNHHVVAGGADIEVVMADGTELAGTVIGADPEIDIALVKVGASGLTAAPLGDSDKVEVGEWVVAIGNPFGLEHTATAGIVSAVGRTLSDVPAGRAHMAQTFIQTDASINPGNSGGPLINAAGEVIGIATAIDTRGRGIGFAVPIDLVKDVIPALRRDGRLVRSWLGVYLQPVTDELARDLSIAPRQGVFVAGVVEGSPAAQAGLMRGDVILEFGGRPVDERTLPWRAAVAGAGQTVKVKVLRQGAEKTIDVRMQRLPG